MSKLGILHRRWVRRTLLVAPFALGITAASLAAQPPSPTQEAAVVAPVTTPAPTPAVHITVEGNSAGITGESTTTMTSSDGTHVQISKAIPDDSGSHESGSASNTSNGNVSVSIGSGSHDGSSWSSTQTTGGNANGSSTSYSSTSVFSAGSSYTHVSGP